VELGVGVFSLPLAAQRTTGVLPLFGGQVKAKAIRALENKFFGLAAGWRSEQPNWRTPQEGERKA